MDRYQIDRPMVACLGKGELEVKLVSLDSNEMTVKARGSLVNSFCYDHCFWSFDNFHVGRPVTVCIRVKGLWAGFFVCLFVCLFACFFLSFWLGNWGSLIQQKTDQRKCGE